MKKAVVVLGIVLMLALVAHQVRTYMARRDFEERAKGIERLEDFAQPPIPDEQNVAAGLMALATWIEKHDKDFGHSTDDFDIYGWEDLKEEQLALGRRYVESVASIFPRLEEVLRRPHYRIDMDWDVIPIPREYHAYVRIKSTLIFTARVAKDEADIVRVVRLLLRLSERLEMPFVIGHALGIEPRRLAVGAIHVNRRRPELDVAFLRRELDGLFEAAHFASRPSARALRQERAYGLAVTDRWSRGRSADVTPEDGTQRSWLRRPHVYNDAVRYIDLFDKAIMDCETTSADHAVAVSKRYAGDALVGDWWMTDAARNVIRKHFLFFAEDVACLRLARVALALMQARQDTGKWPSVLPGPKLIDPFSGEHFRYEVRDDEVRLYAAKDAKGRPEQDWKWLVDSALAWTWPK